MPMFKEAIKTCLGALLLMFGLLALTPTPAQAVETPTTLQAGWPGGYFTNNNCETVHVAGTTDPSVCVRVGFSNQADGSGYVVRDVDIWCSPSGQFEGDWMVNGYFIRGHDRTTREQKWFVEDGNANIENNCYRTYAPNDGVVFRVGEGGGWVVYPFKARLDNAPDQEGVVRTYFG